MATKKTIAEQLRARLSPVRRDPEEGDDNEQGDFEPPQNQQCSTEFDTIVGAPSRKDKSSASGSASTTSARVTVTLHDDFILQQSVLQERLKQMFLLASSLGSKFESVAEGVA